MNFHQASRERTRYDLRTILHDTVVKVRPDYAVTFVDNHECVFQLRILGLIVEYRILAQ